MANTVDSEALRRCIEAIKTSDKFNLAKPRDMTCKNCGSLLSAVTFNCVRGNYCKPNPDHKGS